VAARKRLRGDANLQMTIPGCRRLGVGDRHGQRFAMAELVEDWQSAAS
jgi:hypothetical protein